MAKYVMIASRDPFETLSEPDQAVLQHGLLPPVESLRARGRYRRPTVVVALEGVLVQPSYDEGVAEFLRPVFQKVYTMSFDNYPVEMERIRHPRVVQL